MGRVLQLPTALSRFRVPYIEDPGWRTRGRSTLNPCASVAHGTGSRGNAYHTVRDGRPGLSGPLAQVHLPQNGVANIIASGVANHAGGSNNGPCAGCLGNQRLLACEPDNDNQGQLWPARQYYSNVGVYAAFCWIVGRDASSVCAHWQIARHGKIDPNFDHVEGRGRISFTGFRMDINHRLKFPSGQVPEEQEKIIDKKIGDHSMYSFIGRYLIGGNKWVDFQVNIAGGSISIWRVAAKTAKGLETPFYERGGLPAHTVTKEYIRLMYQLSGVSDGKAPAA